MPSKHLCFECKVIKPPRSHHCSVCNRCVDRFDSHSTWTNNCVGRQNAGYYFAFIFYTFVVLLLMGWLAFDSIAIKHCEIDRCIYESLCFYCDNLWVHDFVCYFDSIVCLSLMVPALYHTVIQCSNFCKNETTYERFTRKTRSAQQLTKHDSFVWEDLDDDLLLEDAPRRRGKQGCWANCGTMCCSKAVISQKDLMKLILKDMEYSLLE